MEVILGRFREGFLEELVFKLKVEGLEVVVKFWFWLRVF